MDDLIEAPPTTAIEPRSGRTIDTQVLRQRPNQFIQGVMSFFAVVGIGAAVTLAVHPPLRVHVIERRIPVAAPAVAAPTPPLAIPERKPEPPRIMTSKKPHPKLAQLPKQPSRLLTSKDCDNDLLCGIDDSKQ